MSIIDDFIDNERKHYTGKDSNLFAFSLAQSLRYYDFLLIVAARYEKASEKAVSAHNKLMKPLLAQPGKEISMTVKQMRLFVEQRLLQTLVHLEIESFYMFAKIFLDKIALFIQNYFGPEQGISLRSHDKLEKEHERFRLAKGLTYPQGFSRSIIFLKEHISDYRDKQISHMYSQRAVKGTTWGDNKQMKITTMQLFPTGNEFKSPSSEDLSLLLQAIDTYIQQLIAFIESNRAKTRFELKQHSP